MTIFNVIINGMSEADELRAGTQLYIVLFIYSNLPSKRLQLNEYNIIMLCKEGLLDRTTR